jgi:hypothetical protein
MDETQRKFISTLKNQFKKKRRRFILVYFGKKEEIYGIFQLGNYKYSRHCEL